MVTSMYSERRGLSSASLAAFLTAAIAGVQPEQSFRPGSAPQFSTR